MPTVSGTRSSVEEFERDSVETPPFSVESLPPSERDQAMVIADGARTLLLKALLHRLSPEDYPVVGDRDSLEAEAVTTVNSIAVDHFARLAPRLRALADDQQKVHRLLGRAASYVDLRRPAVDRQLTKMSPLFPTKPFRLVDTPETDKKPKFNRLMLNVRKLHCVDETNPEGGTDDMILGGVLVGPTGHAVAMKAFVAGEFDDGEVHDYGAIPWGPTSLGATSGYPKNIYCIFSLVESDSDDGEVAAGVSKTCAIVAKFATAIGQGVAAAAFTAAAGAIDMWIAIFVDEDEFPPYGVRARLDSQNEFGSDGVDINRHTNNITAHGGSYRVGFRWELMA